MNTILMIAAAVTLGIAAILVYQGHQMYRENRKRCIELACRRLDEIKGGSKNDKG